MLTAVLRYAALLVGASLPLVCMGAHLRMPDDAVMCGRRRHHHRSTQQTGSQHCHSAHLERVQAVLSLPQGAWVLVISITSISRVPDLTVEFLKPKEALRWV